MARANGILVLAPSALGLAILANAGRMDGIFITVQAIELIAGVMNLTLIGLNICDGMRMRRTTTARLPV